MAALLPCPFCGSSEVNNTSYEGGREVDGEVTYVIVCPDCVCSICPTLSLSEAVAAWNMRPDTKVGTPSASHNSAMDTIALLERCKLVIREGSLHKDICEFIERQQHQ